MSETALEVETTEEVVETPTATPNDPAPKTVPAERFNGLQRAHQEALTKLRAYEAAAASPSTPATTPEATPTEDSSGLEAFLADLMAERLENWRDAAIAAHPDVPDLAKWREYLTANTRNEVLALAKDFAERLGGTTSPSEEAPTVTATETPSTPSPAVTGGSPAISAPTEDEELNDLRAKAARTHSDADYSAYLQKKFELAGVEYPS